MKAYVITVNSQVNPKAPTTLQEVAKITGVNPSSLYKGRRIFVKGNQVTIITEVTIIKPKRNVKIK